MQKAIITDAPPRWIALDLLRFLAIVLVLGRHMALPPREWPMLWRAPLVAWQRGGWVGVDLFFVLSGFLVAGLLFTEYKEKGRISPLRFYVRRAWKIYPAFFVLVAVTASVRLYLGRPLDQDGLLAEVLFLQSYLSGMWNHTWSLAVAGLLKMRSESPAPRRSIFAIFVAVAAACLLLRLINWQTRERYSDLTHQFATHLRLDSLLFGVLIAYAYHFHTSAFRRLLTPRRRFLIVCGTLLLMPAFMLRLRHTPFVYTAGFTLFSLASGMVLVGLLLCEIPRSRVVTALAWLGACSYSMYLWHMPVRKWLLPLADSLSGQPLPFALRAPLYLIASVALGALMAKLVEVPMLRLRDRTQNRPPPQRTPMPQPALLASDGLLRQ